MDRGSAARIIAAVSATARSAHRLPYNIDKAGLLDALHGVSVRADIEAAIEGLRVKEWRRDRSLAEWLMAVRLPAIYARFFRMKAGASTPSHVATPTPGGPYIRFVLAAFDEYGIVNPRTDKPYKPATVRAALSARGRKRPRRCI